MNILLFGIYPYVAFTVCILGCWYRYKHRPMSWKADSSMLLASGRMHRLGLNLLHWGILLLLMGHVVGLLTPHEVYESVMSPATKQLVAMVAGGIFGAMVLAGLTILLWRRLALARIRRTSTAMDYVVLVSLLLTVVTGLWTIYASMHHLDGHVMIALALWAQHIVTLQPDAASFVADVPLIYKLHIFFGLTTLFALFPFGRLVHAVSGIATVVYVLRPQQVVRTLRPRVR